MGRVEGHVSFDSGASQDVMRKGRGGSLFKRECTKIAEVPHPRGESGTDIGNTRSNNQW